MPSINAARCQGLAARGGSGTGAVSAMNCSSAATIAAASCGGGEPSISTRGRGGLRFPFALELTRGSLSPHGMNLRTV